MFSKPVHFLKKKLGAEHHHAIVNTAYTVDTVCTVDTSALLTLFTLFTLFILFKLLYSAVACMPLYIVTEG